MVRNMEKRFKNSLLMNTRSRNAVMVCCRGNYGYKILFPAYF